MTGPIAVVDADNRFLSWADKATIHGRRLPHRTVHILLLDSQGRMVLQQRHRDKLTWPLAWDMACCGHVERPDYPGGPDEDLDAVYDDVAHREMREELGVDAELETLGHFPPEAGVHYEHLRLYLGFSDGPFSPQAEELEEIRQVTAAQYDQMAADPAITLTGALIRYVAWLRDHRGLFLP